MDMPVDQGIIDASLAGSRLVPEWVGLIVQAKHLGGMSQSVYKLTCEEVSGETRCCRVFKDESLERREQIITMSVVLANLQLAPSMVGADDKAIVQQFIDGSHPDPVAYHDVVAAGRLGSFVAALHSVPIDPQAPEEKKARIQDLTAFVDGLTHWGVFMRCGVDHEAVRAEIKKLENDLRPMRQGDHFATFCWTHGDLHLENMLETKDTDGNVILQVVDLCSAGPRPRVTDIAYLFATWGLKAKKHPPLESRQSFAREYLAALQLQHDDAAIDDFLWSVECEQPLQVAWLSLILLALTAGAAAHNPQALKGVEGIKKLWDSVGHARAALVDGKDDPSMRSQIIKDGAVLVELRRRFPWIMFMAESCAVM